MEGEKTRIAIVVNVVEKHSKLNLGTELFIIFLLDFLPK